MPKFIIQGGKPLKGTIEVKGAKNEAYQVIIASLLTDQDVRINNVPQILDIINLIDLLKTLGVKVQKMNQRDYIFNSRNIDPGSFDKKEYLDLAGKIRGSAMLLAPFLIRFGYVKIPKPGGDRIGRRPLDTHFNAFKNFGAKVNFDRDTNLYTLTLKQPKSTYILLDEASVTATANILMLAVRLPGRTTLYNAACEPYIVQLCNMLNNMGARITGMKSNLLTIDGVDELEGVTHTVSPDIMEVGSFIGLAAATNSDIMMENLPVEDLRPVYSSFMKLGIKMNIKSDSIHIPQQDKYRIKKQMDGGILNISDNPWPRFPTDLISIIIVAASQAVGNVLVRQRMFESRLFFVDHLIEMGAQVILCDPHRVVVVGTGREIPLRPANISSPDIRAGLALLIAALAADGESTINNINQIDRGYESIDQRLIELGADINRVD